MITLFFDNGSERKRNFNISQVTRHFLSCVKKNSNNIFYKHVYTEYRHMSQDVLNHFRLIYWKLILTQRCHQRCHISAIRVTYRHQMGEVMRLGTFQDHCSVQNLLKNLSKIFQKCPIWCQFDLI